MKTAALLALAAAACATSNSAAPGSEPAPAAAEIPLVALPAAGHPTVAFRLAFQAGAVDDPAGKEGLTELTALVMAEGGTEKLDVSELKVALFPFAAEQDFLLDKEETVFVGRCPADAVSRYLPILE